MTIPIYIDGEKTGSLRVEACGCCTLLRGELKNPGRLVRLTVYGEGEMYLGVPQPEGGRLLLCRKLTPREMRRFPRRPQYAAEMRRSAHETEPEAGEPDLPRHVLWQGGRAYYF